MVASEATLYFGYGSNLWLEQMALRCPTSVYRGVGRLSHWQWIINARGYANVVLNPSPSRDTVYGLVYSLEPQDEAKLDVYEGVKSGSYEKQRIVLDLWPADGESWTDVSQPAPEQREMLVYVDPKRTQPYLPRAEYITRMNRGIDDALRLGVPATYVQDVMRPFIPPEGEANESHYWKPEGVTSLFGPDSRLLETYTQTMEKENT